MMKSKVFAVMKNDELIKVNGGFDFEEVFKKIVALFSKDKKNEN